MTISLLQASEYWVRDSLQLKKKERVIIDRGDAQRSAYARMLAKQIIKCINLQFPVPDTWFCTAYS